MESETDGSITGLFPGLQEGVPQDEEELWNRYFDKLVALSRTHLRGKLGGSCEEDVALSALNSFLVGIRKCRFDQLDDRGDLWNILKTIARRKAAYRVRAEATQKRGGNDVLKVGTELARVSEGAHFNRPPVPTAEEIAEFADMLQGLLAKLDPIECEIIEMRLADYNNSEIARRIGKSEATVRLRLKHIAMRWSCLE